MGFSFSNASDIVDVETGRYVGGEVCVCVRLCACMYVSVRV